MMVNLITWLQFSSSWNLLFPQHRSHLSLAVAPSVRFKASACGTLRWHFSTPSGKKSPLENTQWRPGVRRVRLFVPRTKGRLGWRTCWMVRSKVIQGIVLGVISIHHKHVDPACASHLANSDLVSWDYISRKGRSQSPRFSVPTFLSSHVSTCLDRRRDRLHMNLC